MSVKVQVLRRKTTTHCYAVFGTTPHWGSILGIFDVEVVKFPWSTTCQWFDPMSDNLLRDVVTPTRSIYAPWWPRKVVKSPVVTWETTTHCYAVFGITPHRGSNLGIFDAGVVKSSRYVGNHNTLLCSVGNNTTQRFEPGHLWCWSGEVPPINHLSVAWSKCYVALPQNPCLFVSKDLWNVCKSPSDKWLRHKKLFVRPK